MRRIIFGGFSVGLLGLPLISTTVSDEAKLIVTATILKRASLEVLAQPGSVRLTAADISRGYVDVPGPLQVAVHNNSADGYMLTFENQGEFIRQTLVRGLGQDVQLDALGGSVVMQSASGRGMQRITLHLGFRFALADSARQGVYAWPMRLSVIAL
ncbi:MAG: hypothetical protein M3R45_07815 [Pseudomonadota bacterium]|nr:hypothetical protein [Pseudomonadota bacterium]